MPAPKKSKSPKDLKKEIDKAAKLFDVAKPGSTPASATSRPVIVKHSEGPKRDPMVNKAIIVEQSEPVTEAPESTRETEEAKIEASLPAPSTKKMVIEPLDKAIKVEVEEEKSESIEAEDKKTVEEDEAVNKESSPEEEPASSESAAVGVLAKDISTNAQEKKEQEELEAKYQEVEMSIERREFFVPIKTTEQKRNTRLIVVLLIIIVLAASAFAYVMGPGADQLNTLINKKSPEPVVVQPAPTPPPPTESTFVSKPLNISFKYPLDWKVTNKTYDMDEDGQQTLITVLGPKQTFKYTVPRTQAVEEREVHPRVRIVIGDRLEALGRTYDSCSTEPITVMSQSLSFLSFTEDYTDSFQSVSNIACKQEAGGSARNPITFYKMDELLKFAGSNSKYMITFDYKYSDDYMAKRFPDAKPSAFISKTPSRDEGYALVPQSLFTNPAQKQAVEIIKSVKLP